MKKGKVKEKIFEKHYDGIIIGIRVSDLPKDLLPTGLFREREETDEEFEKNKLFWEELKEKSRKARYEQYQKLKKEFEETTMKEKDYEDILWCDHCEKDTKQTVHDSYHERDSSGDWRICHECGWRYSGLTGRWEEPYKEEQTDG